MSNREFSPLEMAWRRGISLQIEEAQTFAMPADILHVPSLQIGAIKGQNRLDGSWLQLSGQLPVEFQASMTYPKNDKLNKKG